VGWVLAVAGTGITISAVVDAAVAGDDAGALVACGVAVLAIGGGLLAWVLPQDRSTLTDVFAAVGAAALALVVATTIPYLATGTLSRLDDAVFEATAGITTTSFTVLDVDGASRGILLWRSLSQWIGGGIALVLAVSVLPFLGAGEGELKHAGPLALRSSRFLVRARETLEPVIAWYAGFTVAVTAAYLAAGMGAFDAVAHALTTVSTGGMSTRAGSIGAFDSAAVEWVGAAAMLIAGGSVALYVAAMRSRRRRLAASTELRAYLVMIGGASAAAVIANAGDGPLAEVVRHSVFTVASYASTTGFVVTDVAAWVPGLQAMLLVLVGVGAMTGSPGGGFKVLRLLALLSYVRREIVLQLHDRAVVVVRVGRDAVSDELVQRMIGYQAIFSVVAGLGALGLALAGVDVITALSGAASAISNAGPGLGRLTDPSSAAELAAPARGVLMLVMLAGRVEIYPLVVGLGAFADWAAPGRRRRMLSTRLAGLVGARR
jgi:trk system potassium uptake protein TrkH